MAVSFRSPRSSGSVAIAVTVLGGVAVLALWWVPWSPVPGGVPDRVDPATVLTGPEIARGEALGAYNRAVSWTSLAVSILVALWFGLTGRGAALVRRLPGPWWIQVPLAVLALGAIGRFATLPFSIALWRRRLSEGLSTQGWGDWFVDIVLNLLVTTVTTSLAILVVMGCARWRERWWPALAAALAAALVVLASFVYPLLVEPLFNDFEPLPEGELHAAILALGETEGVDVDEILVADASRRTTTLNAYVSGFAGTHRVVLYDTAVTGLDRDQLLSIVAHELAHAKHRDVLVGTGLGAAGAVVGIGLLALIVGRPLLRRRSGADSITDPAVVPLVLALVAIGSFLVAPVQNGISRQIERRADVTALETTHDPQAFIAMQRELAVRSVADPTPNPFGQFWFGSHPPMLERVALALRYAEEEQGD